MADSADDAELAYREIGDWIARQRRFADANGRPAPLTSAQRNALAALQAALRGPAAAAASDGAESGAPETDWISLLFRE